MEAAFRKKNKDNYRKSQCYGALAFALGIVAKDHPDYDYCKTCVGTLGEGGKHPNEVMYMKTVANAILKDKLE